MLQLKKFPDIPVSTREEARESRTHPEEPVSASSSKGEIRSLRGRERIPGVPVASQEEALSTGKAKGTPASCHHSKSLPDVSVHSRETCFPCTALTFKRRIDSHHGGTWDSPVGKPRGKPPEKASWESHRYLDPREGKRDTAVKAREETARACPHSRRGLTPLGRLQESPKTHVIRESNPQVPAPNPHKVLVHAIDRSGIPRGPRATRMGTAFPEATRAGP